MTLYCAAPKEDVEQKLSEWRMAMAGFNGDGNSDINLQGEKLERVTTFKYLGATLAENGDLDVEIMHRIQSECKTGREYRGFCVTEELG